MAAAQVADKGQVVGSVRLTQGWFGGRARERARNKGLKSAGASALDTLRWGACGEHAHLCVSSGLSLSIGWSINWPLRSGFRRFEAACHWPPRACRSTGFGSIERGRAGARAP